jgi:uncharacterized DUF497 family protein
MDYVWEPAKNRDNIKKHKVSFEQAKMAIEDPHSLFQYDEAHSQTEDRYIVIGNAAGRILFINEVEIDEDTIRIVSARRAQRNEVEAYNEHCSLFLGKRT